jgi:uncharacterized protein (TIGR03086 family)
MLTVATAASLRAAGLRWDTPRAGDRFVVAGRDMDDDLFVLSDMTIEARDYPTGRILGFNGTTEWALDSVAVEQALWLPREDQLRAVLGPAFRALRRDGDHWHIDVNGAGEHAGTPRSVTARDVEEAYALAVLTQNAEASPLPLLPVAAEGFSWRVHAVPEGGWRRPTPATGWSVRDVVNHVVSEHLWAPHLIRGETLDQVGDRYDGDVLGDNPVPAWDAAIDASLKAWAALDDADGETRPVHTSAGQIPATEYADQMLLDLVVHAWDMARGAGLDDRLDEACAGHLLRWARPRVADWASYGVFEPPVPIDSDDPQDQLVALTGRDPR